MAQFYFSCSATLFAVIIMFRFQRIGRESGISCAHRSLIVQHSRSKVHVDIPAVHHAEYTSVVRGLNVGRICSHLWQSPLPRNSSSRYKTGWSLVCVALYYHLLGSRGRGNDCSRMATQLRPCTMLVWNLGSYKLFPPPLSKASSAPHGSRDMKLSFGIYQVYHACGGFLSAW